MNREEYEYSFLIRLRDNNRELLKRQQECAAVLENMLQKNTAAFPDFTDHTTLHSINVQNFASRIVGEHIKELSAEEIYCFSMAVATHDIGMGVRMADFNKFSEKIGIDKYMSEHPDCTVKEAVRRFHNDLSACVVMEYYELFNIPDETYAKAIALIGQGHRKMDLLDKSVYPIDYKLSNGAEVRLPLLAALIRLADEIDMAADRNSSILYSDFFETERTENDYMHMRKHESITKIQISDADIIVTAVAKYPEVKSFIIECVEDLFDRLQYANEVMKEYESSLVTQNRIIFNYDGEITEYRV